jgi:hypothetical protein
MSDFTSIAQLLSAGTNLVFVVIVAVGYYMTIRLYRRMIAGYDRMLSVTEAQRTAMGRPQVIVDTDYGDICPRWTSPSATSARGGPRT